MLLSRTTFFKKNRKTWVIAQIGNRRDRWGVGRACMFSMLLLALCMQEPFFVLVFVVTFYKGYFTCHQAHWTRAQKIERSRINHGIWVVCSYMKAINVGQQKICGPNLQVLRITTRCKKNRGSNICKYLSFFFAKSISFHYQDKMWTMIVVLIISICDTK